jgi:MtN3 and saliva related transmembrane protein
MTEAIGWISSVVLVLTIGKQVHKQWRSGSSEGVSRWLFVGQVTASLGFMAYSWLVHNWVFVVTNTLMLVNALLGLAIVRRHRRCSAAAKRPLARLEPQRAG